ncbi:MAG: ROK family protein [Oscillospiraceae bacterium]|nr:ROK family protein [Oscillospiraceae bacterium]
MVTIAGINLNVKNLPELDREMLPLAPFFAHIHSRGQADYAVAIERSGGLTSVYRTKLLCGEGSFDANCLYVERLVKFLLWARGGFRVVLCGDPTVSEHVKGAYLPGRPRAFDADFMSRVYEHPFEVVCVDYDRCPNESEAPRPVGRHLDGCRIGFDAGGSDRKVSAVIDGTPVYSEEVVWFPKENSDPAYHYDGIVQAMKTAAAKMPRVDAIGVSSAGIYLENRTMAASLFLKVPLPAFDAQVKDIYIRAAREIGPDIPLQVANDGDVTALAGAMGINDGAVLGIAMGTSQAAGYIDAAGNITGWLNELAFVPVDAAPGATIDEWSGDRGCGVKYFSQDAVIKLALRAGIELVGSSPAEKLAEVQALMGQGDERAAAIYRSIGVYFGHALAQYAMFFETRHVLVLGRVVSGKGGDILLSEANRVLAEEYAHISFRAGAPDEKARRVGQSVAAASLPATH